MLRTILVPSQQKGGGGGTGNLPTGGTAGQCLVKVSDQDGDVGWSSDAPVITDSTIDVTSSRPISNQAVAETLAWNDIQGI